MLAGTKNSAQRIRYLEKVKKTSNEYLEKIKVLETRLAEATGKVKGDVHVAATPDHPAVRELLRHVRATGF